MGALTAKSSLGMVFVAIAVYIFRYIYTRNWFNAEYLKPESFVHRSKYTVIETEHIPTTYYHKGRIGDVLKGWYKEPGSYFHLFRLHPGETFEFDPNQINSKTQANKLLECNGEESVICPPCYKHDEHEVIEVSQIFNSSSSDYYSSFAKLEDVPSVKSLFTTMNFTGIDFKKVNFEHAFVSNLPRDRVTAQAHGNSLTSSMAVQFIGSKVWLFFSPKVFRGYSFLNSFAGTGIVVPTQSPLEDYDVYRYVSQPGDVLFFGENWGHIVLTKAGPNFMMNFRKIEVGNAMRQPLDWIHAFVNSALYPTKHNIGRKRTPYNEIMKQILAKTATLCDGKKRSEWDDEMMKLLRFEDK